MEFFIKNLFEGKNAEEGHRHFIRFGRGNYRRRFMMSLNKGKKIKIRSSFELANDFVKFVKENKDVNFTGKIFMKDKIPGKEAKKKGGSFVYEISESSIEEYEGAYFYLLNANSEDIVLKIKKSIPKPGKDAEKIDDKFCSMDLDPKYFDKVKELFFWDVPDCKKAVIEHDLIIEDIVLPEGESNPVKMRELAKRKGKMVRRMIVDGKEIVHEKEFEI